MKIVNNLDNKHPFSRAVAAGMKDGYGPLRIKESVKWFQAFIRRTHKTKGMDVFKGANGLQKNRVVVGKMYVFGYDALNKETLPYWDGQPLIFPFAEDGQHFWGINMHYLPPQHRAIIMDKLYSLLTDSSKPENMKLRLSWETIQAVAKDPAIGHCVKCYLKSHVRTQFLEVPVPAWNAALFMPLARWHGASAHTVYAEARRKGKKR